MRFFYSFFPKIIISVLLFIFALYPSVEAKNKISSLKPMMFPADTVKGTVVDDSGKPVFHANIQVQGQSVMVTTGKDGVYSISIKAGLKLIVTCNGFYPKTVLAGANSEKIQLHETFIPVADSVNALFGKKSASSLLSAVSTISGEQLTTAPATSLYTALTGQLPGLNIGQNSGLPQRDGDALNIAPNFSAAIRGYSNGSDLLVLIDGVPKPYLSIDPTEIESVTILKDALSTVMYGMRSTPGIVSIVTKKGNMAGTRISFTAQTGVQTPLSFPDRLSAFDYANLYNKTQIYSGGVAPAGVKYSAAALSAYQNGTDPYLFPDVDWRSTALKNTSKMDIYNMSLQGSGSGIHYFVGLDYLKEYGFFQTSDINQYNTNLDFGRIGIRSNAGITLNKTLTLDVGLYARIQDQTQPGNGDAQGILNAIVTTPALAYPVYNPNGTFGGNSTYGTLNNVYGRTTRAGYALNNTKDISFDIGLTQRLDELLKGLYLKGRGTVDLSSSYSTGRLRSFAVVPISAGAGGAGYIYGTAIGTNADIPNPTTSGGAIYRQTNSYYEALAGYEHVFGDHNVSAKLVANRQVSLRNDGLPTIYDTYASDIAYNYKEKYFAEAGGSYGYYNQFGPGHQYEPFYALGLGWNLAKENIIKNNIAWVTNLKIRGNYGKTGFVNRVNYGYFDYQPRYGATGSYYYFGTSSAQAAGFGEVLTDEFAEVEKAKKLNIGVDLGLFHDHLALSADYFNNNLYDIRLAPGAVFQVLGAGYPKINVGKQTYYGSEFTLKYQNKFNDFNYFVSANVSIVQSKLVYNSEAFKPNDYQYLTGAQVGLAAGYTAIGLFRSQGDLNSSAIPTGLNKGTDVKLGDIKYLDRNSDGVIDEKDAGPIGATSPQIVYGATLGFSYKGLDFSMLIQGVQNRVVNLTGDAEWAFRNSGAGNAYPQNLDAYFPDNPNGTYPRLNIGTNTNNELYSTFWLHKANFARLKNVVLGYKLPYKWTSKIRVPSARIFVSGENLITVTDLDDFGSKMDPEVLGSTYPLQRTISFGINIRL